MQTLLLACEKGEIVMATTFIIILLIGGFLFIVSKFRFRYIYNFEEEKE